MSNNAANRNLNSCVYDFQSRNSLASKFPACYPDINLLPLILLKKSHSVTCAVVASLKLLVSLRLQSERNSLRIHLPVCHITVGGKAAVDFGLLTSDIGKIAGTARPREQVGCDTHLI
jgi:hypothetical protein